ncbi:beta-glucosidase (plasmid) [Fulvitalea axinellae]|uniref:beta-glucosidase n=1 Tax=Fulvitalea axinellae TaxID=1182444 RepID=A0AAU9D1V2_9BACT|nr:beta-glucosidase [Fulvitalea axinellae]
MKHRLLLLLVFLYSGMLFGQNLESEKYKDPDLSVEERVNDLLSKMTMREKVMQLTQSTAGKNNNVNNIGERVKKMDPMIGSLIYFDMDPKVRNAIQRKAVEESRLGIPIIFGQDVIHGYRSIYPIPLAQASSFNPGLSEKASAMAAREAYLSGVNWTFSPMIDVSRDPRWGRVAECYGEDPYVIGIFAEGAVKGYQGDDLSAPNTIAACLKHFIGYGVSEGGRDYHYTDISKQALWETYLPPYEAGVKAGVATLMSSFNDISGVPATANSYILRDILKEKWGHDGFVVSDWKAVAQLKNQGVAKDDKEAGLKAFMAGVEMCMVDGIYDEHLEDLVNEGKVPADILDDAVKRVLRIKFRLGLFDNPYCPELPEKKRYLTKEDKALCEEMAAESMVLLKNKDNTLPLKKGVTVALIGPMANEQEHLLGSWHDLGKAKDVTSIYTAFKKKHRGKVKYAKGCDFKGNDRSGFADAIATAKASDAVVVCVGEMNDMNGENASRSTIKLSGIQEDLVLEMIKTGKPVVVVLATGRPIELQRIEPKANAIMQMWQPGIRGAEALVDLLSGKKNPSGKLAMTFPRTTGQIPVYYNMRQAARLSWGGQYQDISTKPMYWFGHGLSYTNFEYGTPVADKLKFKRNDVITVTVDVKNAGNMAGKETVIWYVTDPACSISRPMKEVKFFEKKMLPSGGTERYSFVINPWRDLSYVNDTGKRFLEAGEYIITVGGKEVKLELLD